MPLTPYTEGLLNAIRQLLVVEGAGRLAEIPGSVPSPALADQGCSF